MIAFDPDVPGLQIFVMDVASRKVTPATREPRSVVDFSWSPDGTKIVFAAQPSPRIRDVYKTDIFMVDLNTGVVRDLVKKGGDRHKSPIVA